MHTFSAPGGGNLNGDITWNDQPIGGVAFETLFDPNGNVAAYSLIGANQSGFGHVEVHNPMAGHLDYGDLHGQQRAVLRAGPVRLFDPELPHGGQVSPASSRTLKPGQTGLSR